MRELTSALLRILTGTRLLRLPLACFEPTFGRGERSSLRFRFFEAVEEAKVAADLARDDKILGVGKRAAKRLTVAGKRWQVT